ncbi:hypothetical protein SAMN05428961_11379 [Paenibacillus sp. OK060]|nr:hypothetical protein SAMN05428961_11379 [Paenibacillus sp. OK060]
MKIKSHVFQVSELPAALNNSLDELFKAINEKSELKLEGESIASSGIRDEIESTHISQPFKKKVLSVDTRNEKLNAESINTESDVNPSNFPIGLREY